MHANAEHWHDKGSAGRLSFRTLQRGNAILDALRPLLNAEALSAFDYSYSPAASG